MPSGEVHPVLAGLCAAADLGGDEGILRLALAEPAADRLLARAAAVRVRGVDHADAELPRLVEALETLLEGEALAARGDGGADAADPARPEEELGDGDAAPAQLHLAHPLTLALLPSTFRLER
ncbi:hypothetical protein GCM10025866_22540 [Naasia aerilata]|uniref:Uncharacterized protein n=1 Tax=Naasia aerilata TaxID=1162966 RepID=A0ABM8GDJ3_9MICO|nr:hypothetical protein GCM10025866_22540 [Naasia aerilata]